MFEPSRSSCSLTASTKECSAAFVALYVGLVMSGANATPDVVTISAGSVCRPSIGTSASISLTADR